MLSTGDINVIRKGCSELDKAALTAFSLAAVRRVLPVYQIYSELNEIIQGYGPTHNALVAIDRLLRREGDLTLTEVGKIVDAALKVLEADFATIYGRVIFDLPEIVTVEVVNAATAALNGWKSSSADESFRAATCALEVDMVWAEETVVDVISWERLTAQFQQQVRDLEELRSVELAAAVGIYRTIAYRSEREGISYMNSMEELMKRLT